MKKEVQEYITELLTLFSQRIPSFPGKHNLKLSDKGVLQLDLRIGEYWQTIIFDYEDEFPDPKMLFDAIILEMQEAGLKF